MNATRANARLTIAATTTALAMLLLPGLGAAQHNPRTGVDMRRPPIVKPTLPKRDLQHRLDKDRSARAKARVKKARDRRARTEDDLTTNGRVPLKFDPRRCATPAELNRAEAAYKAEAHKHAQHQAKIQRLHQIAVDTDDAALLQQALRLADQESMRHHKALKSMLKYCKNAPAPPQDLD